MANLELKSIQKSYGSTEIIRRLDLSIDDGEFVVFVGPSGCGKSTLLRMIAGLEEITQGDLWIGNRLCNGAAPHERGIAMVFQSYALYPHMTVEENIAFHLRLSGRPKAEIRERVQVSARILQIEHLLDRLPAQLSGGQRQRVAIGRAIVRKPEVFLFDEPLSNLDAALRLDTRMEIARLHRDLGATMVYVTHDQVEAMTLADRIVVLDKGIVQQVGAPLELYHRPANLFVAGFIGSPRMNLMDVSVMEATSDMVRVHSSNLQPLSLPYAGQDLRPGDRLVVGVRPHDFVPEENGALSGEVTLTERLGNETILNIRSLDGWSMIAALPGDFAGETGQRISLSFPLDKVHLFVPTGARLKSSMRNVESSAS